jgi:general secretion pathway protein D
MKKPVSIGLASLMTTAQLVGTTAKAQFDDFPPPPPPPDIDGGADTNHAPDMNAGGVGGIPGRGGKTATAEKETGVLTKAQKNKFNKSGSEDITNENFPETIESFDFPNVEISDLIKAIGELTGKNFIIDPGVRGKITIIAPSKLTVAEAYKAFLSSLAINGFTVVPSGAFLKVKSARNAQRDSIETYSGAYYPNSDQMITRIIHLKHISASAVNRDLRILPSKDGEMSVYEPTNSIILSDYGSNIDRVMKIIGQLDVPGFEEQLEVVPIKYAKVKDLADLVDKIVNKDSKGSSSGGRPGTFTAGVPRFSRAGGASSQQGASFFMAIPEERTNSIIIVGNKSGIVRIKKLIAQLDFRVRAEDTGGVYVYNVKYGEAEKIAQTLQGVTKDATPKPSTGSLLSPIGMGGQMQAPQEIFGGDVKITADKTTNSLVITASKQDYEVVLNILRQIDVARDQVFVEAIIMEMSASDGDTWGIGYYQYGNNGYGKVGFNGGVNMSDFLNPLAGAGAVIGFGSGKNVTVTNPTDGKQYTIPSLIGLINFVKKVKKANILSTPQIMTLDNQEGEIEVGDKVVTGSNSSTGANGVTTDSPIFDDATIKLKIKPFISPASNNMRMEIQQSVKQISTASTPTALKDKTQPLATRSIKTMINISDGDTAILGGLIKEQDVETVSKVPLLGDIPIIGWLFKAKDTQKDKVNMVVFISPKIIRNNQDANKIVSKKLDERIEFVKAQGGKDPWGRRMDEIGRRAQGLPPASEDKKE